MSQSKINLLKMSKTVSNVQKQAVFDTFKKSSESKYKKVSDLIQNVKYQII
ncbi:MAG: hypothetical protein ACWIPJ_11525 [Polaribacter sp.]